MEKNEIQKIAEKKVQMLLGIIFTFIGVAVFVGLLIDSKPELAPLAGMVPFIVITLMIAWIGKWVRSPLLKKLGEIKNMTPEQRQKAIEEMKEKGELKGLSGLADQKTEQRKPGFEYAYDKRFDLSKAPLSTAPGLSPTGREKLFNVLRIVVAIVLGMIAYIVYNVFKG